MNLRISPRAPRVRSAGLIFINSWRKPAHKPISLRIQAPPNIPLYPERTQMQLPRFTAIVRVFLVLFGATLIGVQLSERLLAS